MAYTIKIKPNDQDNLNLIPFKAGDKMPKFLNFETVLAFSIQVGYIKSKDEIRTLVDGSDHIEAYFTSLTVEDECKTYQDGFGFEFKKSKFVYEVF